MKQTLLLLHIPLACSPLFYAEPFNVTLCWLHIQVH